MKREKCQNSGENDQYILKKKKIKLKKEIFYNEVI